MNIAFVGLAGVPYLRRACDIRLMAFASAFTRAGHQVVVFNRFPVRKKNSIRLDQSLDPSIRFVELIDRDPSASKLVSLLISLLSYPVEFFKIIAFNRISKIDILQVYSGHFFEFLFYRMLAKVIRAKTIYQYVEYRSEISRKGSYHRINGYLCDRLGPACFDGIIPISNFIEKAIRQVSPHKPMLKVPPIIDFSYFDTIPCPSAEVPFLLYCGSVDYFEVIQTVVDAYLISNCPDKALQLKLVVHGNPVDMAKTARYIHGRSDIQLLTDLPYKELIALYKSATALLIPMRNTIQDIARFPNKICEYTAAKNIILTTGYGEIPYYFSDGHNALIAQEYSASALAAKIRWIMDNPGELAAIKNNAWQTGRKYFNTQGYVEQLDAFVQQI